jgi:hypothetical protein
LNLESYLSHLNLSAFTGIVLSFKFNNGYGFLPVKQKINFFLKTKEIILPSLNKF